MKSPSSVKPFTVATAPPSCVEVGRITEHRGRLLLMKLHGSGRILLVWVSSVAGLLRSGKVSPVTGSTTPAKGWATALPPLSCHSEVINLDSARVLHSDLRIVLCNPAKCETPPCERYSPNREIFSYVRMFPVLQLIDVTTELRHGVLVLLGRPSSRYQIDLVCSRSRHIPVLLHSSNHSR